jgi:hypothetical protein
MTVAFGAGRPVQVVRAVALIALVYPSAGITAVVHAAGYAERTVKVEPNCAFVAVAAAGTTAVSRRRRQVS